MAVKFFGQFLVEKGAVTREQLLAAIELQDKTNLKLGEMAVKMGLITQADIVNSHNAQYSKDIRLGDLLVEMGLLTPQQLADVVDQQKKNHLYIGEALVQVNALTSEELQKQLAAFKADQAQYVSDRIELPAGLKNSAVWEMTADLTFKLITRVLGMNFRCEKSRIISTIAASHLMAAMDFEGDVEARYLLSVSANVNKGIARAILREDNVDSEPIEVLEDTVMEFVNVVCGNVAAKGSQMGIMMDIKPPLTIHPPAEGVPVPEGQIGLCFPIHVVEGEKMELVLLIKK